MKLRALTLLLNAPLLLLQGCITAKQYRPVGKLTPLMVPPKPDAIMPGSIAKGEIALPIGTLCQAILPNEKEGAQALTPAGTGLSGSGPCIAFIEYDNKGNHYKDEQVSSALALIHAAIAADPDHQPVIVAFVHGWKHNANPGGHPCTFDPQKMSYANCQSGDAQPGATSTDPLEDANIQGFEHVLNFLYHCAYAVYDPSNPCQRPENLTSFTRGPMARMQEPGRKGHVVIGIYFGWYGADISPLWPVAQQISVYSRGTEADHVAHGRDISDDLKALSAAAHPTPRSNHEPLFILAGHSFGARLLEQAVTTPLKDRITEQLNSPDHSVPNFADLILFINPAAPAENAVDLFNFLGQNHVRYQTRPKPGLIPVPEPLLASITTPADAATGVIFTAAFSLPSLAHLGTTHLTCFDPAKDTTFPENESTAVLYRNTLPHLKEFQSHTFNDQGQKTPCVDSNPNSFAYSVRNHCYFVEPAPNRWNNTPYWIMSTDEHVIPDHGTIFTNRLLDLIAHFLPDDRDKALVTR